MTFGTSRIIYRKAVNRMCFTNTNKDMTGVEIPIDI